MFILLMSVALCSSEALRGKSGWIFRAGGAGYILLNVMNGLAKNTFSISDDKLKIAAGIFLFGELLRRTYKLTLPIGKKYHLKFVKFSQ